MNVDAGWWNERTSKVKRVARLPCAEPTGRAIIRFMTKSDEATPGLRRAQIRAEGITRNKPSDEPLRSLRRYREKEDRSGVGVGRVGVIEASLQAEVAG